MEFGIDDETNVDETNGDEANNDEGNVDALTMKEIDEILAYICTSWHLFCSWQYCNQYCMWTSMFKIAINNNRIKF